MTGVTNAELASAIQQVIAQVDAREDELLAWQAGTSTGGPFGDGRYPITNLLGETDHFKSPARLQYEVSLLTDAAAGAVATAEAARDAAQAAETNATSEADRAASERATAATKRDEAQTFRDEAANSEANALVHRNAAAASEANAATSEANAATSEQNAATSEANAAQSEQNAAASAAAAQTFDPANYIPVTEKAAASGVATLDANGKVVTNQLPPLVLVETFVCANETEQLAANAQQGDVAVRTDLNKSFIHLGTSNGTMADWQELLTPTDAVQSVDGRVGNVTLSDLYAAAGHNHDTDYAAISHGHDWSEISGKPTTYAPSAHGHDWSEISDKPSTFAPSAHTHSISDVTGLQTALDSKIIANNGGAAQTINTTLYNTSLYGRGQHNTGYLVGGYNNIGASTTKSNPIFTIGTSYGPNPDDLANMYGVGYTNSAASFITGAGVVGSGWGFYVAADGDARVFLSGSNGTIGSTGDHYVGGNKVWHEGSFNPADYVPKYVTSSTSLGVDGGNGLNIRVNTTGGWARHFELSDHTAVDAAKIRFGGRGSGPSATYAFIGVGANGVYNSLDTLRVYPTYAAWGINKLWHEGNFDPATKADASHTHSYLPLSGGALTGDLTNTGRYLTNATPKRDKIGVWSSSTYVIGMDSSYTFGALNNDYAMTFQMNNDNDRGFWWGDDGHTKAQGAMSLTTDGRLAVATNIRVGYGESDTSAATATLDVNGNAKIGTAVLSDGGLGLLRSQANGTAGYVDIGCRDSSWGRVETDRSNFYMNKTLHVNGGAKRYGRGFMLHHANASYGDAQITVSTSAPSGGTDGDIWLKV